MSKLALALVALLLAGCAGYHSVPPERYSAAPPAADAPEGADRVHRVVFDQRGDIYPPQPNNFGLAPLPQPPNRNSAFLLRSEYGSNYQPEVLTAWHAAAIARQLEAAGTNRVVFLIKGYNNSYEGSWREFAWMRNLLRDLGRDGTYVFVEVYWDSLYSGPRTFPAPLAFWFDSMTYSNKAGQVGLRRLIDALPDRLDATFLTHSRGVAVALSALIDPLYDEGRGPTPAPLPLPEASLSRATVVAFAPAIGRGHVEQPGLRERLHRFYVGFNRRDPATRKKIGIPRRFGDTSLNANDGYYVGIADRFNAGGEMVMQREILDDHASHAWEDYMDNNPGAGCLLWAGRLIAERPETCTVTR